MFLKGQVYSKKLNAQAANNESSYLDKRTMDNTNKDKQRQVSNVEKKTPSNGNSQTTFASCNQGDFVHCIQHTCSSEKKFS